MEAGASIVVIQLPDPFHSTHSLYFRTEPSRVGIQNFRMNGKEFLGHWLDNRCDRADFGTPLLVGLKFIKNEQILKIYLGITCRNECKKSFLP